MKKVPLHVWAVHMTVCTVGAMSAAVLAVLSVQEGGAWYHALLLVALSVALQVRALRWMDR